MDMKTLQSATELTCPRCQSRNLYRTKRKGFWERIILYPLGFRAYRCEDCDARFCTKSNLPIASKHGEDLKL
jgi:DNA-directed RNA polymerase subunit RPC12/RpoP